MRKTRHVEVRAELSIHPHEKISIERGGHPERIVVGEEQFAFRLDEVGSKQQRIAGDHRAAKRPEERTRIRWVEITEIGPEKQHQHPAIRSHRAADLREPFFIRRLMRDHQSGGPPNRWRWWPCRAPRARRQ